MISLSNAPETRRPDLLGTERKRTRDIRIRAMRHVRPLLLVLAAVACAPETARDPSSTSTQSVSASRPAPSVDEARALLASAPEFGDYQFTNASIAIPLDKSKMNEPAKNAAADLERAGWVESQRGSIVLSSKSASDKRFLVRPNGFLEIVPLAKKEITEVGAVTTGPDGRPVVTFCWRWVPNDVGASLTSGPQKERFVAMHCAKATLIAIGEKWEVLQIDPDNQAAPMTSTS